MQSLRKYQGHSELELILKFIWNHKRPWIAKEILTKIKVEGSTLPDIKLYYKARVIKKVWYWHKNKYMDEWNRMDSPEICPHLQGQLVYDKGCTDIQWGKDGLFNEWHWQNLTDMQGNETGPLSYTIYKNKLKNGLEHGWQTQACGANPALPLVLSGPASCFQTAAAPSSLPLARISYIYTVLKLDLALWRQPWGWCGSRWKWVWHPWIRDLNVRLKTTKLLEENIGSKLFDNGLSNIFLDMSPWERVTKEKINRWDYIKLKKIAQQTKPLTKGQSTEWQKIFASDTSEKSLIAKIYKKLIQLNILLKKIWLKNGERT